jgi:PAS domain S-box-containing protein
MPPTSERTGPPEGPPLDEGWCHDVLEHLLDGAILGRPTGQILYANPAACSLLHATSEELCRIGRPGITDASDPRWVAALEERSRSGRVHCEAPFRRPDGTIFLAEVASAIFTASDGERSTVIFRDVTERIRLERRLSAIADIHSRLLKGESTKEVLTSLAQHARVLVDASDAAIVVPGDEPGSVLIHAGAGPGIVDFVGRQYPPGGISARVMASKQAALLDDLATTARNEDGRAMSGPAMIVPIFSEDRAFGTLVVHAPLGSPPYNESDLEVAGTFAQSAGVALALGEARSAIESNLSRTTMQLEEALARRVVVEQAKGFISASLGVGTADAFERLRSYARRNHQKVHDVAGEVLQRRLMP